MKESRFRPLYQGLNSQARKVYDATPISEYWDCYQIKRELQRAGITMDLNVIKGCLGQLLSNDLISRDSTDSYRRVMVERRIFNPVLKEAEALTETKEEITMTSTTKTLAAVAQETASTGSLLALEKLTVRMVTLAIEARKIADEMEVAILEAHEHYEKNSSELADLRQLKELMQRLKV